jgi:hypothetical protein
MKLMRITCTLVAALAVVSLSATQAAAQGGPIITYQQTGASLRIDWTAVPGANAYDLVVGGALNGQVTIPTNFLVVNAPPGTYTVQVRGRNGATVGEFSAVTSIVVGAGGGGGAGCPPIDAPVVTATVTGTAVTINWPAVGGAAGYLVRVGNTPGGTIAQVQLPAGQTGYSSSGPIGTYYVRVTAGNACGAQATSTEQSFTLGAATPGPAPNPGGGAGTGPRSADPPAGQLIPRASLGYLQGVVTTIANQYRGDLLNSCTEFGGNHIWMFRLVRALRSIDSRWGLNDKRGQAGDMSHDIVTFNPTNRPDNGESQVYLFDVISGHCGSNPGPNWADVTDVTWAARGNPACGTEWCARWTLDQYLRAGFQP